MEENRKRARVPVSFSNRSCNTLCLRTVWAIPVLASFQANCKHYFPKMCSVPVVECATQCVTRAIIRDYIRIRKIDHTVQRRATIMWLFNLSYLVPLFFNNKKINNNNNTHPLVNNILAIEHLSFKIPIKQSQINREMTQFAYSHIWRAFAQYPLPWSFVKDGLFSVKGFNKKSLRSLSYSIISMSFTTKFSSRENRCRIHSKHLTRLHNIYRPISRGILYV